MVQCFTALRGSWCLMLGSGYGVAGRLVYREASRLSSPGELGGNVRHEQFQ